MQPSGELLDVRGLALLWGTSQRAIRGRVARKIIPYRKIGGRVVFLKREIEEFTMGLPGVQLSEAKNNLAMRVTE